MPNKLFNSDVTVAVATSSDSALFPEELCQVTTFAPRRLNEYSLGRAAARLALASIGEARVALTRDSDGVPVWPRNIVGSITHCEGFCGAAVARKSVVASVGFDAERCIEMPEEIRSLVLDEIEVADFTSDDIEWPMLAFSAKEAFYKCYFPLTREFLSFTDVTVKFERDGVAHGTFQIKQKKILQRHPAEFFGTWQREGALFFTGSVLSVQG